MTEAEAMGRSYAEFITAWIALHEVERHNSEDQNSWSFEVMFKFELLEPESCWRAILDIIHATSNENVLGALAAGPIEALLARHGADFIARVEERANADQKFRQILDGVWQNNMPDEIWARVQTATHRQDHEH